MRLDGYIDATIGPRQYQQQAMPYTDAELYDQGGLPARIVDLPADTALSRGIEIEGDEKDDIRGELERLNANNVFADACRWSRLSGGSAIVLLTDTGTLSEPLPETFGRIEQLRVFDLADIAVAPGGYYSDATQANYGQPELYRVNVNTGTATGYFEVHESRVLPIPGAPMSRRGYRTVPWQGRSAVNRSYKAVRRYTESLGWALRILERKQQPVHKMAGLADMIQNGLEDVVRKRIDLVDQTRGILNGVAVDSEDDYTIIDLTVAGIKDLVNEFQVAISAETGIPVTLLFGRSASGLNATGENDLEGFYDLCEGIQRTQLQPALERLIGMIQRQTSYTGLRPEMWSIAWPSLWTPTEAQQAEIELKRAQAEKAHAEAMEKYADMGAMSSDDIRRDLIASDQYGLSEPAGDE